MSFVRSDKSIVSVTAAVVRYESLGKPRTGVTTTFICDRFEVGQRCPVFINKNPEFRYAHALGPTRTVPITLIIFFIRLPEDGGKDIIMIGPGTGIAPFRAFIHERLESKATGANVLYFGCRHRTTDFLYRDELVPFLIPTRFTISIFIRLAQERFECEGKIKLRTAFSRDQEQKVYVQHRIAEDADMIWRMLEVGEPWISLGNPL